VNVVLYLQEARHLSLNCIRKIDRFSVSIVVCRSLRHRTHDLDLDLLQKIFCCSLLQLSRSLQIGFMANLAQLVIGYKINR
jgi:hypothetical protein